jgi:hypothetical protein
MPAAKLAAPVVEDPPVELVLAGPVVAAAAAVVAAVVSVGAVATWTRPSPLPFPWPLPWLPSCDSASGLDSAKELTEVESALRVESVLSMLAEIEDTELAIACDAKLAIEAAFEAAFAEGPPLLFLPTEISSPIRRPS